MPEPPFPTRPGSPLAAVSGHRPGPMPWSLGVLGDLLWTRLPETRPSLADLMVRHIEDAVNADRALLPVQAGEMVPDALWFPVLEPALDGYPAGRDRLAEQLRVVFEAYQADGPDQSGIRYALETYLFEYLTEIPYGAIVAELSPELSALVARVMPS